MDRQKGEEPEDPRSLTSPVFQRLEVRVGGRERVVEPENPPPGWIGRTEHLYKITSG